MLDNVRTRLGLFIHITEFVRILVSMFARLHERMQLRQLLMELYQIIYKVISLDRITLFNKARSPRATSLEDNQYANTYSGAASNFITSHLGLLCATILRR